MDIASNIALGYTPELRKCIQFMSLYNEKVFTFQEFTDWVHAHEQTAPKTDILARTRWQHQVPFFTPHALEIQGVGERIDHQQICIDPLVINSQVDMNLLHGFLCCGKPGNKSYETVTINDYPNHHKLPAEKLRAIHDATVGAKLYFGRPRHLAVSDEEHGGLNLVIVTLSMRVNPDETIECLRLQVRTNTRFNPDDGELEHYDGSYRNYIMPTGWLNQTWRTDHFAESPHPEQEQIFHRHTIDLLLGALC